MILKLARSFWLSPARKRRAAELYIALVRQSRKPFFFEECGVADTLDGRFDLIVLHVFLMLREMKLHGAPALSSRLLQESMYDDMDRSLREMGVGDMGVSKRVGKMSKAAYARIEAYTQSFDDEAALQQALIRNLYRGTPPAAEALAKITRYMREFNSTAALAA